MHITNFQIMSQEMYSTITLLMKKRQQVEAAMANLDVDKVSRQEKRKEILLSMVEDVIASLDASDKEVVNERKKEGQDLLKTIDRVVNLATSVEEETFPSIKKEIEIAAIDEFVQNSKIDLNANESLLDASRNNLSDAFFLSTQVLNPQILFLQMPEKNIHFEPMSDKTKFVELNIFAVTEDAVFNELLLNSIHVEMEMSHSGQKVGNSIIQLMKEHKATISDDGGYVTVSLDRPTEGTGRLAVKVLGANVVNSPLVHNFGNNVDDASMVDGTLGNLDMTGLDESNLAQLDTQTRRDLLFNASKQCLERTVCYGGDSTRHGSLSARAWVKGDLCIARWVEDEVWYNAEVLEVCEELIRVKYTDYGNTADVGQHFVLERVEEIPEEDLLANLLDVHLVFKVSSQSLVFDVIDNTKYFSSQA